MSLVKKLEKFSDIINKKAFAHLSTIEPNGFPHTTPVWFSMENNNFLVNTAVGRRKDRNMKQNPEVALSIQDPDNPYSYVSIQGTIIERTKNGADDHIDSLAKKYLNADKYPYRSPSEVRVVYKIKPTAIFGIK